MQDHLSAFAECAQRGLHRMNCAGRRSGREPIVRETIIRQLADKNNGNPKTTRHGVGKADRTTVPGSEVLGRPWSTDPQLAMPRFGGAIAATSCLPCTYAIMVETGGRTIRRFAHNLWARTLLSQ